MNQMNQTYALSYALTYEFIRIDSLESLLAN